MEIEKTPSVQLVSAFKRIRSHLKCRSALYRYFKQHRGVLLPGLSACDMQFLQQLLRGEKQVIPRPEALPGDETLSERAISKKKLAEMCQLHPTVSKCIPDNPTKCSYEHLCRVVYCLDPELYGRVVKAIPYTKKTDKQTGKRKDLKRVKVVREFADILLKMQPIGDGRDEFLSEIKSKEPLPGISSSPTDACREVPYKN